MNIWLMKIVAAVGLLLACLVGGFLYGHHVGAQAGASALNRYKAAQAQAVTQATQAAQHAQASADAQTLAEAHAALAAAQAAAEQRQAVVNAQAAKVQSLEVALRAIPSSDKAAATWLGPLPPSIRQALNPPEGGAP